MTTLIHLAVLIAFGALTLIGNPIVRRLLSRIDTRPTPTGPLLMVEKELPGGRWIGALERIGIYASIVAGFPAGIGLVLAVKGLGRYPELRNRDNPRIGELFIIGTLASSLVAAACAGLGIGVSALLVALL